MFPSAWKRVSTAQRQTLTLLPPIDAWTGPHHNAVLLRGTSRYNGLLLEGPKAVSPPLRWSKWRGICFDVKGQTVNISALKSGPGGLLQLLSSTI